MYHARIYVLCIVYKLGIKRPVFSSGGWPTAIRPLTQG